MTKSRRHALLLVAMVALCLVAWGCKDKASTNQSTQAPPMGGPPRQGGGGETGTKAIMTKIAKGPTSLNELLKGELKTDQPDWPTIQPQAAEYARLAGELGKADPPKGSKESWTKLTAAFSESATALDTAAKNKELAAARTAQEKLGMSCMQCHQEHRGGPGGRGAPGGRGGPPPG
jgi:cytochrome c556